MSAITADYSAAPPRVLPDDAQIERALALLAGEDDVIELRAIYTTGRKRIDAGYFDGAHRAELIEHAARLNRARAAVYINLNPLNPQLLGRYANRVQEHAPDTATDGNIIRRHWLLLDFDPSRPKNTSATEPQLAAARARANSTREALTAKGWPAPVVADSGNGAHLLYRIDLPNDDATRDLVRGTLEGIAARFDDAAVCVDISVANAARITKLYGTVANKGDHTAATPHRLSRIIEVPEKISCVTADQLRALHVEREQPRDPVRINGDAPVFDLLSFLERLGIDFRRDDHDGRERYRLANCPFDPAHGRGEAAIFRAGDGRLGFKCVHNGCADKTWQDLRAFVDGPRGTSGTKSRLQWEPNGVHGEIAHPPGANGVRAVIERAGQLAAIEWPDPEPLRESIVARPYPLNALPPIVLGAVNEVADFSQAPKCLVAASAIGIASIACQGLADVRRDGKLIGPASLYMLVIAESGERKTTCDAYFSRALRDWCAEQFEKHKPLLADHEAKLGAWESRRAGVRDAIKLKSRKNEATSDLERKLEAIEKEKPERPRAPRLIYGDATPEALAYGLAHDWPSAGLVSNEAGSVFGGHAMQRDSIMRSLALLNILWDGGTHTVARRTSDSFSVSGARMSVSLMAQLPTLRSFVERAGGLIRGTGFLARFLIAWPETTIGTRTHKEAPASWPMLEKFHERAITLLSQPLTMEHGALRPVALTLSPEAFKEWCTLHDDVERDMASSEQFADVRDIGSKTAENAARLAAVFHLMEHGTEKGEIDAECMNGAAKIAVWHLVEAKRLLGELDASPELSAAERLDAWLMAECRRRKATAIPTRDVLRDGPLATRSQKAMLAALDQLTSASRAWLLKDGKRRLIEVNPALLEAA
jgi:hypothetical protein